MSDVTTKVAEGFWGGTEGSPLARALRLTTWAFVACSAGALLEVTGNVEVEAWPELLLAAATLTECLRRLIVRRFDRVLVLEAGAGAFFAALAVMSIARVA